MKLKSFGCSFVFGSELSDIHEELLLKNPMGKFSRLTWPALLSDRLGYNYECYARPGAGNLQIAERALTELANKDFAFYVINWSWIDRFDFCNSPDLWQPWSTIRPAEDSRTSNFYYKELHSEYQDKLTSLMYMRLVIDTLKQKECPFIMTYMDNLTFDQRWHTSPAVLELQDYIKPHTTTFDDLNFLDWSKKNGYPITNIGHPLETAHRAASNYIIKVFDKQNTIVR